MSMYKLREKELLDRLYKAGKYYNHCAFVAELSDPDDPRATEPLARAEKALRVAVSALNVFYMDVDLEEEDEDV